MKTKIAINGFGRIGMLTAKAILSGQPDLEIVAVNDLAKKKFLKIKMLREKDPSKLPWKELGVDIVLECSGFFTDYIGAKKHLLAGAKKVIISAPASAPAGASAGKPEIPTYLLGVNAQNYKGEKIISMGSCTTNAAAPVLKVLDERFGIEKCFLNTTHSYTASQNKFYPNWENKKSSQLSIIPSSTGASKTIEKVLPQLKGKVAGVSLRVPTATVSIVDLVCLLKKSASAEKINSVLKEASLQKPLKGILQIVSEKMKSSDLIGNPFSSVVEGGLTQSFGNMARVSGNMARVFAWYDNEYAYALRLSELPSILNDRSKYLER